MCPAGAQSPGTGDRVPAAVDRHTLSKGTELWVARVPHAGPAGVSLVFPGGVASEVRELARQVGAGCPGPAPVLGAGPDYEILSLSRRPEDVPEALDCLGSLLR